MLSTIQKFSFAMSFWKNVLVMDAGPMDTLINDFPEECLERDVSPRIGISYLSLCQQNEEDILKQTVYRGVIMGNMRQLFVSIPTKHPIVNKYYNVHYLVDTGSPITTLTRKALCTIHELEYNIEGKNRQELLLDRPYQIASQKVQIICSNPDKYSESRPYHNINLLGMDFLGKFEQILLNQNFHHSQFIFELSKNRLEHWDKKLL